MTNLPCRAPALGLLLGLALPPAVRAVDLGDIQLGGVIQVRAVQEAGSEAFVFGCERVRVIAKGRLSERVDIKLQAELNREAVERDKDGETSNLIKDAVVGLRLPGGWALHAGKFKTPVGMEFNQSGPTLEIIKRGAAVGALVFERNVGAMVSGPEWTAARLRLDAGLFNYGPAGATNVGNPYEGADYSWAGRLRARPLASLELQAFGGLAVTSVAQQEDVAVAGAGLEWRPAAAAGLFDRVKLELEALRRDDPQNGSADGLAWYAQLSAHWLDTFQPALRYEVLDVDNELKDRGDLTVGLNWFPDPGDEAQAKLMLNWVRHDYAEDDDSDGDEIQLMLSVSF